ncbi:MAG: hypothetical protein AABW89_05725 [Nanoarchaeota archaeon]
MNKQNELIKEPISKWKKYYVKVLTFVVLIVLIYTMTNGLTQFWRGYHQLDTAQNFLQLGYKQDVTIEGEMTNLKAVYLDGLNRMIWGFGWLCFDVILGISLGWLIGLRINK